MVNRRQGKKKKEVTFILLPNSYGNKSIQLTLSMPKLIAISSFFFVALAVILISFFYSMQMSGKLLHYYYLQAENTRLNEDMTLFVDKTKQLDVGINELEMREKELRKMLGLTNSAYKKKN